ncbi:MAG: hypothetical protein ACQEW8_09885 [Actinomycetota bacterium]
MTMETTGATMKNTKRAAARDRTDLVTAVAVGVFVAGLLLGAGIRRMVDLFAEPGAMTVRAPLDSQTVTTDVGEGVPGLMDSAILSIPGVNTVSIVCLVLSIVLATGGLVATTALATVICIRLLRGAVFDRVNIRLLFASSMLLLLAGIGAAFFENMGLNGVFAAAGDDFDGQTALFLQALPQFAGAMAVGVLVIVFRRGAALQRETDGLV